MNNIGSTTMALQGVVASLQEDNHDSFIDWIAQVEQQDANANSARMVHALVQTCRTFLVYAGDFDQELIDVMERKFPSGSHYNTGPGEQQ